LQLFLKISHTFGGNGMAAINGVDSEWLIAGEAFGFVGCTTLGRVQEVLVTAVTDMPPSSFGLLVFWGWATGVREGRSV